MDGIKLIPMLVKVLQRIADEHYAFGLDIRRLTGERDRAVHAAKQSDEEAARWAESKERLRAEWHTAIRGLAEDVGARDSTSALGSLQNIRAVFKAVKP
jgi:hypothetical protein